MNLKFTANSVLVRMVATALIAAGTLTGATIAVVADHNPTTAIVADGPYPTSCCRLPFGDCCE